MLEKKLRKRFPMLKIFNHARHTEYSHTLLENLMIRPIKNRAAKPYPYAWMNSWNIHFNFFLLFYLISPSHSLLVLWKPEYLLNLFHACFATDIKNLLSILGITAPIREEKEVVEYFD